MGQRAQTVSKEHARIYIGFGHVSSIDDYAQKGHLEAVKVEGVRAKQITIESLEQFERERRSSVCRACGQRIESKK